ncbi:hypothetical protein [Brevundimonas aurantiaca]|uniref:hypothetical protein n=1 Tax=Brevundimonas aurantiaca TaxID=74316 RepID=UPI00174E8532|nr:hypothetical protein [Brevundimonas aurantiaca]
MGWCAFQIHGLRSAFAIGDEVKLSCGVSGEVLTSLSIDMLGAPKTEDLRLSALDLVALLRQSDACPGLEQLLPFALNHYRRHGARQFIEASYLTLLGRWPDPTAPDVDFSLESDAERITVYIEDLIGSQEYKEKWGGIIPGPFVSGFRFDTTELI